MKKQPRFRVGDEVTWEGGPNELSVWRSGKILSIKRGEAEITDLRDSKRRRKMPIKRLNKKQPPKQNS